MSLDALLDRAPLAMEQVFLLLPVEDLCTCLNSVSPRWTEFIRRNLLRNRESRGMLEKRRKIHHW